MHPLLQIIILGIVQGIAEFLPISSSGHLVIMQQLVGLEVHDIFLDIVLHLGTLCAVVLFMREFLLKLMRELIASMPNRKVMYSNEYVRIIFFAMIGCVPAFVVAVISKDILMDMFASGQDVGYLLLINGFILMTALLRKNYKIDIKHFTMNHAIIIGAMQACALLPGISRSGITITTALLIGVQPQLAFRFSFLMAIPAIIGALAFTLFDAVLTVDKLALYVVGFVVALISGYISLVLLKKIVEKSKLHFFSIYCWVVAILVLVLLRS